MPKVLLITFFFPPKLGGIEYSLMNLCQKLPKEKIIVLTDKENNWQEFDKKQIFKIYRTKFFISKFLKPSWLPLILKIWQLIKKERIEIILFGHYAHYCLIGSLFKKIFKIPFLIYARGVDILIYQKNNLSNFLLKFNLRNASKLLANSHFTKNEIIKLGIPEKNVIVIYPGIDLEKFNPEKVNLKEIKKIKEKFDLNNKKIILSVGRIVKIKGFDLVIKALPEIKKHVFNIVYLIIGKGEFQKELKNLIEELNLKKDVIFVGEIEKPEKIIPYYFLSDLYVGPSRVLKYHRYKHKESFGTVFLEAQAMGKPVVATKTGGINEAVSDGQTGLLVPPEDIKAIAQAIVDLLTKPDLYQKFKSQTRKWVEKFSWNNQIDLLIKTLNQIKYGK